MEQLEAFARWAQELELDWRGRTQQEKLLRWTKERKERNGATFGWARKRALRNVRTCEKKNPLTIEEKTWLESFEITTEVIVQIALSSSSDEQWELVSCVNADFQLLARAARVDFRDEWLDKLRAEYEAGRIPHGTL